MKTEFLQLVRGRPIRERDHVWIQMLKNLALQEGEEEDGGLRRIGVQTRDGSGTRWKQAQFLVQLVVLRARRGQRGRSPLVPQQRLQHAIERQHGLHGRRQNGRRQHARDQTEPSAKHLVHLRVLLCRHVEFQGLNDDTANAFKIGHPILRRTTGQ